MICFHCGTIKRKDPPPCKCTKDGKHIWKKV